MMAIRLLQSSRKYEDVKTQSAKSPKKQSVGVFFNNMALYFECRINKHAH